MLYPTGLLIAIALLVLLAFALWYWKTHGVNKRRELRVARKNWTGVCPKSNPDTGDRCEREEFHVNHHCRDIDGQMVWW